MTVSRTVDAGDLVVADHVGHLGVPAEAHLVVRLRAVLHDLARPQRVAPVHDRDAASELAQERRLLERGVAATDDRDVLVTEEESVTRRTGGYAVAEQPSLVLEPEVAVLRTRREDHRARVEDLVADVNHLDGSGQVDLR